MGCKRHPGASNMRSRKGASRVVCYLCYKQKLARDRKRRLAGTYAKPYLKKARHRYRFCTNFTTHEKRKLKQREMAREILRRNWADVFLVAKKLARSVLRG